MLTSTLDANATPQCPDCESGWGAYRDGDFKPYQAWQLAGRGVGQESRKIWQCRVCGYVVTAEREPSNRITLKGS